MCLTLQVILVKQYMFSVLPAVDQKAVICIQYVLAPKVQSIWPSHSSSSSKACTCYPSV
jgi:hypothetical protein